MSTTGRCRMAKPGNWWCAATARPTATGTSGQESRRTFQGEWTYTGDTYTRDAEGYFRFQGRSDEMLKVSGVWVSPFEVEEALISHPAVLEAAVIGRAGRGRTDQAEGVRDPADVLRPGHGCAGRRCRHT